MDRTIIATLEQMRSFDYVQGNHDTLLGLGNLAQDILSQLSLTATAQVVVAGIAATQTAPASLVVNLAAGRIYNLQQADIAPGGAIAADTTIVCQQGIASAQAVTLVAPTAGQSRWNLIQASWGQADAVRTNDPTGGIVPFFNSSSPTVPTPTSVNTVRQSRLIISVVTGAAAATGSETPPQPSANCVPLYLVDLAGGQTQILNAQVLRAGPSVGTGVPSNYPVAPFIAGLLASHHNGLPGQAPRINLASEVQGVLAYANMSPVRTLLGAPLTLYVNGSIGNDSNPGTSPSLAFQTIQAAVNSAYRNYDFNGNSCTINVANGTYAPGGQLGTPYGVVFSGIPVGLPTPIGLIGNIGSQGSCVLAVANGSGILAQFGAQVAVQGFTVTASGGTNGSITSIGCGVTAALGGFINIANCIIGTCGTCQLEASNGGVLTTGGGAITLLGTTQWSLLGSGAGGEVLVSGSVFTVTGLVNTAFANATACILIAANGNNFIGTATGSRFTVTANAVINTNLAGANYFPGSIAGTSGTGGQYI